MDDPSRRHSARVGECVGVKGVCVILFEFVYVFVFVYDGVGEERAQCVVRVFLSPSFPFFSLTTS
jgi:hypothetical protein